MTDLGTMLWKEVREVLGNLRSLRVFGIVVVMMGILPVLQSRGGTRLQGDFRILFELIYVVFAAVIVVAQTAPDLVLRERSGHTLETLLASRLPDGAIFAGKVLTASLLGYAAAMLTMVVQIGGEAARAGGWSWAYLAVPQGRWLAFGVTAVLAVYLSTVGSFVALRVGDQRTAYMVTMLGIGVLAVPFLLHLAPLAFTAAWLRDAIGVMALVDVVLAAVGVRLFQRERLILYLQD